MLYNNNQHNFPRKYSCPAAYTHKIPLTEIAKISRHSIVLESYDAIVLSAHWDRNLEGSYLWHESIPDNPL